MVTTILAVFIAGVCTLVAKISYLTRATGTLFFVTNVFAILRADICTLGTIKTNSTSSATVTSNLITLKRITVHWTRVVAVIIIITRLTTTNTMACSLKTFSCMTIWRARLLALITVET